MSDHDVPFGFWVSDCSGRQTYHLNGPNMTFKQSFLGSLAYNTENEWVALDKDGKELGAANLHGARRIVETHARKTTRR